MKLLKTALTPPLAAISIVLAAALPSFATTYFITPDGAGDGTTWANGASLESVLLGGLADGDVLKLKKGVHRVTKTTSAAIAGIKVEVYGGYAGASEAEEPTFDRYATVVSDDQEGDDVWVRFDPEKNEQSVDIRQTGATEPEPIIRDGALNLPPALSPDDYIVYHPAQWDAKNSVYVPSYSGRTAGLLKVTGEGFLRLENLTFSGFGNSKAENAIYGEVVNIGGATVDDTTAGFHLKGVAFVGNCTMKAFVHSSVAHKRTKMLEDCEFIYNRMDYTCAVSESAAALSNNTLTFTNCVFASLVSRDRIRAGGQYSQLQGPIAIGAWNKAGLVRIYGCTFDHLVNRCDTTAADPYDCKFVVWAQGSQSKLIIDGCDFTRNWIKSCQRTWLIDDTGEYGANALTSYARGLRFLNNYTEINTPKPGAMTLAQLIPAGLGCSIVDTIVVSNRFKVVAPKATELYAAPITAVTINKAIFFNDLFADNEVSIETEVEEAKTRFARSILVSPNKADKAISADLANCTFCGSTPGDDVVLLTRLAIPAVAASSRSYAFNSIFWSTAENFTYSGMTADQADWGQVDTCIVKSFNLLPQGNVTYANCSADDPMLVYDAANAVFRPTVRVRGLCGLSTPFVNGENAGVTNSAHHRADGKVGQVFKLKQPGYTTIGTSWTPAGDVLGAARHPNDATAGAVETELPDDPILAVQVANLGGGTVSIGSQYAVEGVYQPVTAVAADGFTFKEWVDEDGNVIGTDETLEFTGTKPYNAVRAVFTPPKATWTFRVDPEKGAFEDGTTVKVFEVGVGEEAPETPVPVANAEWYVKGWDRTAPTTVDSTADQEYNVVFIPYREIRYYDSHVADGGAKDGTSWENAFSELHLALDAAANVNAHICELRVKRGVHTPLGKDAKRAAMSFRNVQLIGGFTGNGAERVADCRATVFCGDVKTDDVYVDIHSNVLGRVMNGDGTFFDFENCEAEDGFIYLDEVSVTTTGASNYETLLACPNSPCDDSRIEGLTFTGYKTVLQFGYYNYVTVTNCDFIGNIGSTLAAPSGNTCRGSRVTDCRFLGQRGSPIDLALPATTVFLVDHCDFAWLCSRGCSGASTAVRSYTGHTEVSDCTFSHYYNSFCQLPGQNPGTTWRNVVAADCNGDGTTNSQGSMALRNCVISDVKMPDNVFTTQLIDLRSSSSVMENCTVEDVIFGALYVSGNSNRYGVSIVCRSPVVSNCTFRNCSATYTHTAAMPTNHFRFFSSGTVIDLKMEKCAVSSTIGGRTMLAYLGTATQVAGTGYIRNCSVANATTGRAILLSGGFQDWVSKGSPSYASNTSSPILGFGRYSIDHNEVVANEGLTTALLDPLAGTSDGLSVCCNKLKGGTSVVCVLDTLSTTTLRNTTIAGNVLSDYGENARAVTIRRSNNVVLNLDWSTLYNNEAQYEIYYTSSYSKEMYMTSSMVANDVTEGWTAYGSTKAASTGIGVYLKNSYFQDLPKSYLKVLSGFSLYTEVPQLVGPVKRRRDKRLFVYHTPKSPYAQGNPELVGVYDADLAATDAVGAERPEDDVRIGAVQETYLPPGMMIFVR